MAVSGATGMLGRHLVQHFARRGWEVRALVRRPREWRAPAGDPLPSSPRPYAFDLSGELQPGALGGVDVLVHAAAVTRAAELAGSQGLDLAGARFLFDAARAAGVPRILFPSSTSARPDAPSRYGRDKQAIEGLLDPERDLALRLGLVLAREGGGLFARMVEWVEGSRCLPLFGGGHQVVQPVHVADVCRAFEAALDRHAVGRLTIASPTAIEFRAFLAAIAGALGRRVVFVSIPFAPVLAAVRLVERLRLPFPITSENLLGLREQRFQECGADLERLGLGGLDPHDALRRVLG